MPSTTPLSVLPGMSGDSSGVRFLHPSVVTSAPVQTLAAPMQLVSAKLPGGELIFVLTNPQSSEVAGSCQRPVAESSCAHAAKCSPPNGIIPPMKATSSMSCAGTGSPEALASRSNGLASPSSNCDNPPNVSPSSYAIVVKREEQDQTDRAATNESEDDADDEDDSIYEEDDSRETDGPMWRPWWRHAYASRDSCVLSRGVRRSSYNVNVQYIVVVKVACLNTMHAPYIPINSLFKCDVLLLNYLQQLFSLVGILNVLDCYVANALGRRYIK